MFARKHTPVPLAAAALLLALWVMTARSGSVPTLRCDGDYKEMISDIENNRNAAIAEINRQLTEAGELQRGSLLAMREQVWDDEEQQRATAGMMRRDCQKAAKANG